MTLSVSNGSGSFLDVRADMMDSYLERLRALPFLRGVELETEPPASERGPGEARLHVATRSGRTTRIVELKRSHLTHEAADRLIGAQSRSTERFIVFAPHVGRELAARFLAARMDFVDLSGNCHFEEGDRYYVHVEGRAPAARNVDAQAMRSSTYRVLLALLVRPAFVDAPVRALAEAAGGVSPQTAANARARFVAQGLLRDAEPFWTAKGRRRAVDLFAMGFDTTLAATLTIGRYRARERDVHLVEAALRPKLTTLGRWAWGGGGACERLTGYFRGDRTVVYIENVSGSVEKLGPLLGLVPDARGPVTLLRSPGPLAFESSVPETVHPLLAWVDLLREHEERATDAAAELFDRYLSEAL